MGRGRGRDGMLVGSSLLIIIFTWPWRVRSSFKW